MYTAQLVREGQDLTTDEGLAEFPPWEPCGVALDWDPESGSLAWNPPWPAIEPRNHGEGAEEAR